MRRSSVVVLGALAGCALQGIPNDPTVEATFLASPANELPEQFKVVTFNVHKEPAATIRHGLAADRDLRDADLIVLQEVPRWDTACSAACSTGKLMGYHALYAPGHRVGGRDLGVAILSRAPFTSAEILELPWHDVHFNAGRRIALVATIQHAGRPITVYAVHLENRLTVAQRRRQIRPILEHAGRQRTPVVIAGDFNTSPFTWIGHAIPVLTNTQDDRLEELVRSHGFNTPVADSGATHRYIGMKLDAIYTRGLETRRFSTARADDVSDHLALWATLRPARTAVAHATIAAARREPILKSLRAVLLPGSRSRIRDSPTARLQP